ncbi:hypothetical protein ANACOL_04368 [Anaerotruncus colihominis DSM 17241]|uniref:Uncharacterized protein n=1 Tax=Anaerotruncus colihominis DSM 17241 TaxID=445972 RepID=B0PHS5_9FIRM|nr:hypothetical protein ANACOL_04368 [Anaerotruncus colihominis DSM 17241]
MWWLLREGPAYCDVCRRSRSESSYEAEKEEDLIWVMRSCRIS